MSKGVIKSYEYKLNAIFRLVDNLIILLTFLALMELFNITWEKHHLWSILISVVLFNFFAESQDAYRSWRGLSLWNEITTVLFSWVACVAILILVWRFLMNELAYPTSFLITWFVIIPFELVSWHVIVKMIMSVMASKGFNNRRVAIAGATEIGYRLEKSFHNMRWTGYKFDGFYDDRKPDAERRIDEVRAPVKGSIEQLIADCKSGKIDVVFITLSLSAAGRMKIIAEKLADTTVSVYMVPDLFTFNLLNSRWVDYQGTIAISIYEIPYAGLDRFIKRAEDVILSLFFLTICMIPMLLIAIGIKMSSPGPILFKQTRYGMDGKKIKVWKFRTMTVVEDGNKVIQATKNDSRVTPLGAFLRKTSFDELPQFFNSLGGGMSIVGPRPHAVAHNEEYRSQIQGYMLRHKVKPGITGLAQINGFRGETDTLDKMVGRVEYDLQYIQSWSLLQDFKIIFLTVIKVFINKNVY